jgi:hypothetical protein
MRGQQLRDMLKWCTDNTDDDFQDLCHSVQDAITTDTIQESDEFKWIVNKSIERDNQAQGRQILYLRPWELAQYLGIYDYLHISRTLAESSLDDLVATIARDDISFPSNLDLRAEQVCRSGILLISDSILGDH